MRNEYDIALPSDTDLRALVKKAYDLSRPQGLGFLHYREGDLDDALVDEILSRDRDRCAFSTDYVQGRAVKFSVYRDDDGLYVGARWFDHNHWSYTALLGSVGVPEDAIITAEAALDKANEEYRAKHA
jgi:hypothetical protein